MAVTAPDVLEWLGVTDGDQITNVTPGVERVLAAVTATIRATHAPPVLPASPTADDTAWFVQQTAAWEQAHIMAAGRLWRRRSTPEGVMNFDAGGVIRVGSFDADVEQLLAPFKVWAFA